MPDRSEVGENLKNIFGGDIAKEVRFGDWCDVGAFLSAKSSVLEQMSALDKLMYEKLCGRLSLNAVSDRAMVTSAYQGYYADYKQGATRPSNDAKIELKDKNIQLVKINKQAITHLLSDVLTSFEADNHFKFATGDFQTANANAVQNRKTSVDSREHAATYHGFVAGDDFNKQLEKRSHWKDPGAQEIHGEYTHRLQWFALTRGHFAQQGSKSAQVFESIGKYKEKFDRGTGQNPRYLYLWDALCDRTNGNDVSFDDGPFLTFDSGKRGEDFRSPENLNNFLMTHEGHSEWRWPMLREFLSARYRKREFEMQQAKIDAIAWFNNAEAESLAFQLEYLSRKLYNRRFETLRKDGQKQKTILALAGSDHIWKL